MDTVMQFTPTTMMVPLDDLTITKTNARLEHVASDTLVASIASVGLLMPLIARPLEGGKWDVIDGARRLLSIRKGIKEGKLDAAHFAEIAVRSDRHDNDALEISLHANLHQGMHPLDECEAILTLAKEAEGETQETIENDIASRFGKTVLWLQQRVKLAKLAPEAKKAYRESAINLEAATLLTLAMPELQKKLIKRHEREGLSLYQFRNAIMDKKICLSAAMFDLNTFPQDKIQRSLFDDQSEGFFLDTKLFEKHQQEWAKSFMETKLAEGYNAVRVLKGDDWQTLDSFVAVEGKVKKEDKPKLTVFLKPDNAGGYRIYENMTERRNVAKDKVKKKTHSSDEAPAEAVVAKTAKEMSSTQMEIINAIAAYAMVNTLLNGTASDLLPQFIVIDKQFGGGQWTTGESARTHNGTDTRWKKLAEEYPQETFAQYDPSANWERNEMPKDWSLDSFSKMTPTKREGLFLAAVASMVSVPYGEIRKNLSDLGTPNWVCPGADFFSKYRSDQLIDYLKKSGDQKAGDEPKKKTELVALATVAALAEKSYRFGLK